ncbi:DNA ligase [Candidatus Curtissbacteria bacterium RIFCSPHIGHO2_01_FULL_41_44]|uniref:Probable DNA ligase n=1 Tax=Candidatus Curtissbacteria bacterium RIFCSPLOWO2_01_FULL_42_50 TaxID=1797730 RepID=A0A1F5H4Q5_9BACT|nr:MAG: DNA ligase [Candidatus Curtissbacteria bacterium RIFCSPHIGHO2_01_FULL_41_44]OGD93519.1 MAG: DNA ligase [Candidatus Curtissbacteria bacterium RIFCSPHIGHO2_02_FULL_42_58]OGD97827.1 MAG: DNA ligase [Candidatus Curtissbacteria bacterium RIFCSPHIGHO2_12_FULL_42_33]OGD99025.1 MAG: DNA ligase [Candidatus Curtissbacteria bacterium RIFCSPLOWO2_01_FULL_42_50]OGE03377.1 MAG: DNA ligase [Candidatus Curtissbacteria bacterium RIFCSPLOWO2_12_FULL_41_16]OGE11456.1 MAG: DNA ligase [Candidatus Curtissba
MKFSKLAQYYEKLEATSGRLELVDILSKLFTESDSAEIGKICYLIQGRVAPFFEPVEIGMAEMTIAQAVGRAFNKDKDSVIKLYRQKGNFGLAAAQLAQQAKSNKQKEKLSVSEVFEEILKIAKFSGEGTVEKKVSNLADLLKKLDPTSVKHVVNIPLGTLRLGIGDPTVLDALSMAKCGDKSLRPVLENAYNKTSDLGYVAEAFFKHGGKGIKEIKLVMGKPVRPALAERLPNADEAVKRLGSEFAAEPKFDGFRVAVHKNGDKVELFSRNLEDTTHAFPDIVNGVLSEVKAKSAIIEGEAIAYNPATQEFLPFQETTKRRRKYKIEEMAQKLPLIMFAFDLLYLNGKDITERPYKERRKLLESIIKKDNKVVKLAEERVLHTANEIKKFFDEAVSAGLEGLMLKKLDSPYVAGGRGFHWIKFKRSQAGELTDTVDCVLLGVYSGRGKRTEFGVGGLLVGVYDKLRDEFVTISRIGTGLTDEEFREVNKIAQHLKLSRKPARVNSKIGPSFWVEPKVVLEVYADEITKSPIHTAGEKDGIGYALRFPRLVKFREADRRPEDATTVSEVEKMYKQQYRKK